MIRRAALLGAVALLLGATLADAQPRRMRGGGMANPNPSAIVAAELGFARLAQDKGQWTAFRETADKDAVMFVPDAVNAQAWLRKRADPPRAVAWQPYRVFVSCDGSYAASTGPWTQPDGSQGTFNTIWRRQKDGSYKWVLDFGSTTVIPKSDDPIIEGKVADCGGRGMRTSMNWDEGRKKQKYEVVRIADPPPLSGEGQSNDGSLRWRWIRGEHESVLEVTMRYQGAEQSVIREAAPVGKP